MARVSAIKRTAAERKAAEREAAAAAVVARAAQPEVEIPEGASAALIKSLMKKARLSAKKGAIKVRLRRALGSALSACALSA